MDNKHRKVFVIKQCKFMPKMHQKAAALRAYPLGEHMRSPRPPSHNGGLLLRGATEGREGRREKRREDRELPPPPKKIKMRSWSPLARRNQLVQINIFMLLVPASACKAWVLLSKPTLLQWDPGHWRPLELGVVEWSGNRNGAGRKSSERERSGERGKLCER